MKGKIFCLILGHRWIQDKECHYYFTCERCKRKVIFKREYPTPRKTGDSPIRDPREAEDPSIRDRCVWCHEESNKKVSRNDKCLECAKRRLDINYEEMRKKKGIAYRKWYLTE